MLRKCDVIIMWSLMVGMLLLKPCPLFAQERIIEQSDMENFVSTMSKVHSAIAKFAGELKSTKINDIAKVPEILKGITLDEYQKFGISAPEGTLIYFQNDKPVPPGPVFTTVSIIPRKTNNVISDWLKNKFTDFYREIYPILTDCCKGLRNMPVRLENISIQLAPFGIGGDVTIGVNYESPVFGKAPDK